MSESVKIRHVVSIAGLVQEPATTNADDDHNNGDHDDANRPQAEPPLRIANALVEIIVEEAPPAFQTIVNARRADPAWIHQRDRIDRTWTQPDGVFYFTDLPPGDSYRLRVSVPRLGTRYGTVETAAVTVRPSPPGVPVKPAWVEVAVPPTRIHGRVTNSETDEAIAGARVYLRGDSRSARTNDNGAYELLDLVASNPVIEAIAPRFQPANRKVSLAPGQDRTVNLKLKPEV